MWDLCRHEWGKGRTGFIVEGDPWEKQGKTYAFAVKAVSSSECSLSLDAAQASDTHNSTLKYAGHTHCMTFEAIQLKFAIGKIALCSPHGCKGDMLRRSVLSAARTHVWWVVFSFFSSESSEDMIFMLKEKNSLCRHPPHPFSLCCHVCYFVIEMKQCAAHINLSKWVSQQHVQHWDVC